MKFTTFLALVVLFALSTKPLLGAAGALPNRAIRDTSGKNLLAGARYYIVPSSPDVGGLGLASRGKEHCPLDVVVAVDGYQGLPVVFTPVNTKKGVIRIDTDINIYFATKTSCPGQSNVWKLGDFNSTTGQWFVTTGGVLGDPGWQTINNWFKIETYQNKEDVYELTYCPSVCNANGCEHECSSIGIYEDQYGKHLGLNDFAYKVQFQPA